MKKLLIMCGLPYSGKSTFAERVADRWWLVNASSNTFSFDVTPHTFSSDGILENIADQLHITYGEAWSKYAQQADRAFYSELEMDAVYGGQLIIADRTHLTEKSRDRTANKVVSVNPGDSWDVRIAHVTCSDETRKQRVAARKDKIIDPKIMCNLESIYDPPTSDTGRHVYEVNEDNWDERLEEIVKWMS